MISGFAFVSRVLVKRPSVFFGSWEGAGASVCKRLRDQTPDDGLNRLARLLTASAEGASLKKSAIALESS